MYYRGDFTEAMKRNAGLFDIYRLRRWYPVVLALPRISHHPQRLWQQPPQHQEVSDVYALGIQAGGIVLYPLAGGRRARGSAAGPARHFYLG